MPVFHFLRLPQLCQLLIIQNIGFPEILFFSNCSRKIDNLIQCANISLLTLTVILEESRVAIVFMFPGTECRFHINIHSGPEETARGWFRYKHGSTEACTLDVASQQERFFPNVEKIVGTLMRLFGRTELHTLKFKPSKLTRRLVREVVKKHWETTEDLDIKEESEDPEQHKELTEEEVTWALIALEVTKNISFTSKVVSGVQYIEGFTSKAVSIENPSWIHLDSIINSTTEKFDLTGAHPSNSVLNTILKIWITGRYLLNLKFLSWESDWENDVYFPEGFADEVMEGIDKAILTPEDRIQNPFEDEEEEEDGQYVRRADGKLAVVMLNSTIFQLRVC